MGLLDSDADELKKSAESSPTSSGRKVNQSGLGALKSLSKYANLTSKYRTSPTEKKSEPDTIPTVEQYRGTDSSSSSEVGTNQVQSRYKVGTENSISNHTDHSPTEKPEVGTNQVLSGYKVGTKPATPDPMQEVLEVGINQVQSGYKVGTEDAPKTKANLYIDIDLSELHSGPKVGTAHHAKIAHKDLINNYKHNTVGTNQVQTGYNVGTSESDKYNEVEPSISQTSKQANDPISGYKVGTESTLDELSLDVISPISEVGTNRVQTEYKVGTDSSPATAYNYLDKPEIEVGTIQVQSRYNPGTDQLANQVQSRYKEYTFGFYEAISAHDFKDEKNTELLNDQQESNINKSSITLKLKNDTLNVLSLNEINRAISIDMHEINENLVTSSVSDKVYIEQSSTLMNGSNNLFSKATVLEPESSPYDSQPKTRLTSSNESASETEKSRQDTNFNNQNHPGTNQVLSGYKVGTKPSTKKVQTEYKVSTDLVNNQVQSEYEVGTIVGTKVGTNPGTKLTSDRYPNEPLKGFTSLSGAQLSIVQYLFILSLRNNSLITPPISSVQFVQAVNLSENTLKVTIKRLRQKGVIDRHAYKDGKGGWTQYRLSEEIYTEMLNYNHYQNFGAQSGYKVGTKVGTTVGTSDPSSNSNNLNKIKTTTTSVDNFSEEIDVLPEEWSRIDYTQLQEIRFGRTHLLSLYRDHKLTADEVQRSILEFEYDCRVNKKSFRTGPLNALMGILRKGQVYVAPGYESPEDIEAKENLARLKAREKAKLERQEELNTYKFLEWKQTISLEEQKRITAPFLPNTAGGEAALRGYFHEISK